GGMGQYMISGQQMFPNKKKQNAEFKYMNAMADVSQEQKEAMQNDLYGKAKINFYQWTVLKKKLVVLDENEKLVEFMIKTAEIKYKNNTGDITAYYKAKAALGNIHTQEVQLQNEIEQKRIALNTLMHRNRLYDFDIDTTYQVKDFSAVEIDSLSLVQARSDVAAVTNAISLISLQQEAERQKLNPEFGVRFDHMIGLGSMPTQYTLMGMVKIPFARWSSKGIKANVESLRWKAVAQEKQREAVINEALGEAHAVKSEMEERKKLLKLYENEIIPALRRNYQTTQLAYEQNTEKLFVLYDAWEQYNKIQLEYLDQLQQLLMLQAKLEQILEIKE
ncbi:MAG: TolC family protein, partial [Ferruginibacter sp.]